MHASDIQRLEDLNMLRTAPDLDAEQRRTLLIELSAFVSNADWFTVGIMAPSAKLAIYSLKEMEVFFNWKPLTIVEKPTSDGPVFLKANQNTGDVHVRIEHGLGEGILLSCQHNENPTDTFGPFPFEFFKSKD